MKVARTLKSQAGFSLIELMIVVAIIGILASIAVPNFQKFQRRAKQTEGKGYLAAIYSGEKSFQAEWNSYVACVNAIGFTPEGKGQYIAGFAAQTIDLVAGSSVSASCGVANAIAAPPTTTAGATLKVKADLTGTDVGSANAFTAGAVAELSPGGPNDLWTIDSGKNVVNQTSGL